MNQEPAGERRMDVFASTFELRAVRAEVPHEYVRIEIVQGDGRKLAERETVKDAIALIGSFRALFATIKHVRPVDARIIESEIEKLCTHDLPDWRYVYSRLLGFERHSKSPAEAQIEELSARGAKLLSLEKRAHKMFEEVKVLQDEADTPDVGAVLLALGNAAAYMAGERGTVDGRIAELQEDERARIRANRQ